MYIFFSLLIGIILAIMISINGNLTTYYGTYPATFIIHVVGSVFAGILCRFQKQKHRLFQERPLWLYLGGAIGVLTTIFNNVSFGRISMTSLIALGLLGQTVTSLVMDRFGLLGMAKRPFSKTSIPGLIFAVIGMGLMMDKSMTGSFFAVLVSFAAGICVVLSRCINADLASRIGALRGSLVNHLVGLAVSGIVLIFMGGPSPIAAFHAVGPRPWVYIGGTLGVTVVLLFNITVPHISAFRLTVLNFVGQVFTGIVLDLCMGSALSDASFTGGLVIAAGMAINLAAERAAAVRAKRKDNVNRFLSEP